MHKARLKKRRLERQRDEAAGRRTGKKRPKMKQQPALRLKARREATKRRKKRAVGLAGIQDEPEAEDDDVDNVLDLTFENDDEEDEQGLPDMDFEEMVTLLTEKELDEFVTGLGNMEE